MTLLFTLLIVLTVAWMAGWTQLENLVLGIPLVLGLTWAAARVRRWLHNRGAGSPEFADPVSEDPPGRRIVAGLLWGSLLSIVLVPAFHLAAKTQLYRAVADLHGRQILSDIATLERLHEWSAIVKRLSEPLPRQLTTETRKLLLARKINALIREGESLPDVAAACDCFRQAKQIGVAEGLDIDLAVARLDLCAERTRRRALPPGSHAEILRIDRDGKGGMAVGIQLTDEGNRAIVGLLPSDFGVTVDGKPVPILRAEIVDRPASRSRRLAIVVDLSAPERAQLLAAAALLAGNMAENDTAELILCGESSLRVSGATSDRLAVLDALFRTGSARVCALPEAIALAASNLHGRARETLAIFAADSPIPEPTAALLADLGSPVFLVQPGNSTVELRRLAVSNTQFFLLNSSGARASFEVRFRTSRADAGASYRLGVTANPAAGARVSVSAGGENAVTAAARF